MPSEISSPLYKYVIHDHKPLKRDQYVIRLRWMHGDADIYTYTTDYIDPVDIDRAITTLRKVQGKRVGGYRDRSNLDTDSDVQWMFQEDLSGWERDRSCDDCGHAELDMWKLDYYDTAGLAHGVEVFEGERNIVGIGYWPE